MIPDHPLVDLAIGAALALIVLIVSPGVAISGLIGILVLAIIALSAVRAARRRRRRPASRAGIQLRPPGSRSRRL